MIYQVRLADGKVVWMTERALLDQGNDSGTVPVVTLDLYSFNCAYGNSDGTD